MYYFRQQIFSELILTTVYENIILQIFGHTRSHPLAFCYCSATISPSDFLYDQELTCAHRFNIYRRLSRVIYERGHRCVTLIPRIVRVNCVERLL